MTVRTRDPGCDGLLVYGPPGVGKTRFAQECLTAAAAAGRTVARAATSRAGTSIPLGALAHLLPPDRGADRFDPPAVFAGAPAAIQARSADASVVLFVDDIPLLDQPSLVVLGQLIASGVVFLLGTAGDGEDLPTRLSGLWHGDRLRRVELAELSYEGMEHLLQRTPGLVAATATGAASLTARELAVALLATRGLTSQEIADQLVLSVRTVDHHLQHADEKLGITGRKQLIGALRSLPAASR